MNEPVFAWGINNTGFITGYTGPGAMSFLAIPVPEAGSLTLFSIGLLGSLGYVLRGRTISNRG